MQQVRDVSIAIVVFFICLFVYTTLAGPIPFTVNSVQTTKSNFFTTTGTGEVKAVPDTAMVSLGVTAHAATADEAKNQINEVTNKIVADLKNLGIEEKDIKTINFSINESPQEYITPSKLPKSFVGSQTIEVTAKTIELANKAIDVATRDGANALDPPSFVVNEEKRKELTKQARKKAIANAKEKARELASEAGIRLGNVVDIQENSEGGFRYADADKTMNTTEETATTQLNPGENTISVTVTLSFETL